jgi:thioredoxin 2
MSEFWHVVCPHCDAINRLPRNRLEKGANCGKCKQSLFPGKPLELDPARFVTHSERSDLPLVVDFWAPWCGPCRMMAPAFETAAARIEPHARLVKVNTEAWPDLAGRFAIRSIPTLIMLKNGRETSRQSGAMDAASLQRWVESKL